MITDNNDIMMAYNHLAVENFHPKSHWLFLKDPLKMV